MSQSGFFLITFVELIGLVLAFFGTAGSLWCLLDPCWKVTSQDLTIQPYDACYGIWKGCTLPSDGSWICDGYYGKTIIDLNIGARQHYCRAATITGIILSSTGMFLAGLGSQCCVIQALSLTQKFKIYRVGGWMLLVAGLLVASAGSWYFAEIYQERIWYYETSSTGLGFTIGRAIFVALASGLLSEVAGLCFLCCGQNGCCCEDHSNEFQLNPQLQSSQLHGYSYNKSGQIKNPRYPSPAAAPEYV